MSELELPDLLKGRLERHRRPPGGHGRRTEGSQRQPPWRAGDLVSLPATAAWAVEWLILAREAERFLVVPADTNPLVGSRDWAVPESEPSAPLMLRLGHACWVPASRLTAAHGSGELSPLMLAAARRRHEQVTRGVSLSELGAEADTEPELRAWIEDFVSPACQALMALETPAVSGRGSERWLWRVAASLVLGCLGLGFWVALLWREGRRPIFSPPTAELRLAGTDRGTPPLPIHRSGSHFQLSLVNLLERPDEYADDERCDLFEERKPTLANYGRTYIASGQTFSFDRFTGGELIIDDYRGETVPVGVYQMAVWEPAYEVVSSPVRVRPKDLHKPVKVSLTRETADLDLGSTGQRPENIAQLVGVETKKRIELPIEFDRQKLLVGVPVDTYVAKTDIDDLVAWEVRARMAAKSLTPPTYDTESKADQPVLRKSPIPKTVSTRVPIKTRFGIGGRLEVLTRVPEAGGTEIFVDHDLTTILNLLLYGAVDRDIEVEPSALPGILRGFLAAQLQGSVGFSAGGLSGRVDSDAILKQVVEKASEKPEPKARPETRPEVKEAGLERLLELLAEHLAVLDLVVLDSRDMVQTRATPQVASLLARYVSGGGSLFAYVSEIGDYQPVLGTSLAIESMSRPSRRLGLAPGEVEGLIPALSRKDVKVKIKRALPEVGELGSSWRTLAFTKKGRKPRIVERVGRKEGGGHLVLWLDDPSSYRGRMGGTRQKVEEVRAGIEFYVLQEARKQMARRFGRESKALSPCGDVDLIGTLGKN